MSERAKVLQGYVHAEDSHFKNGNSVTGCGFDFSFMKAYKVAIKTCFSVNTFTDNNEFLDFTPFLFPESLFRLVTARL